MDVLTQLESEVDLLLKIMSSSIAFLSRKAKHQVLPSSTTVPLTVLGQTEAISPEEMHSNAAELVADLVHKAVEIKSIILHLPPTPLESNDAALESELEQIQTQLIEANREYQTACDEAQQLHSTIAALLDTVSTHQHDVTAWLASTATT